MNRQGGWADRAPTGSKRGARQRATPLLRAERPICAWLPRTAANTGMAHWPRRGHRAGDQEAAHGPRYQRLAGDRLAAGGFERSSYRLEGTSDLWLGDEGSRASRSRSGSKTGACRRTLWRRAHTGGKPSADARAAGYGFAERLPSNEPLNRFDPSGLQSEGESGSEAGQAQDPAAEDDRLTGLNELKKAMEASQKQAADSAQMLRDAKTRLELLELDKVILESEENNANIRQQRIGNMNAILRQQNEISRLTKHATGDQANADRLEKAYMLLTKTREVDLNDEDRRAQEFEDMAESQESKAVEQQRIDAANTAQENWVSSMMCWPYPDYP
jgi:hypothetical protein